MAFRLKKKEPVQDGVKRIVLEQVDRAVACIDNKQVARDEAIHDVRKNCKRIRAVLQLIRPVFGRQYAVENAFFRDTADELAGLRDAQVLLKTYDMAAGSAGGDIDRRHFAALRRKLVQHSDVVARNTAAQDEKLQKARERFCEARKRIAGWKLDAGGFDAIEAGLLKTYSRGRKAMQLAYQKSSAAAFHEWRKHVNYHRYHLRLLRGLWPPMFKRLRREVEAMANLLGDDHDLAVLRAALLDKSRGFADGKEIKPLLDLIDNKSAELRSNAKPLGKRIYAEKPKQLVRRFQAYWTILRSGK